jgi:hypothetical protein
MRRVGELAVTVLGLWIIASAIESLAVSAGYVMQGFSEAWASILVFLVFDAAFAGFGYWLISKRAWLAAKLFDESDLPFVIDTAALLRLGVVFAGAAMVATGVERLFSGAGTALQAASLRPDSPFYGSVSVTQGLTWVVVGLVGLVVGVAFVRRSERVAVWLWAVGSAPKAQPTLPAVCPVCGQGYDPAEYSDMAAARCNKCGASLTS